MPASGPVLGNASIRCPWRVHFEAEAGATGVARVLCRKCRQKRGDGLLVLHRFDLATGDLIETRLYRDIAEYLEQQRRERDEARASVGS